MSTRLPGPKYKTVFARGRPLKGRFLAAWRFDAPDAGRAAGVVVSKKTFSLATDRNRAKRLVREAYRLLAKEGTTPDGANWIFAVRRAVAGKKCADVAKEMRWLFSRDSRPER